MKEIIPTLRDLSGTLNSLASLIETVITANPELEAWRTCNASVMSSKPYISFHRPFNAESGGLDTNADPRPLARAFSDEWKREGGNWKGYSRDLPTVEICIFDAEPKEVIPEKVTL